MALERTTAIYMFLVYLSSSSSFSMFFFFLFKGFLVGFSIFNFDFSGGIRTPIAKFESRNSTIEPQGSGDIKCMTA